MTKPQLKSHLQNLHLDKELEALVNELIDSAQKIDNPLCLAISEILDLQADWLMQQVSLLTQEAEIYNQFSKATQKVKANDLDQRIVRIKALQKKLEDIK
ncbi:hypothetical protein HYW55_06375 [Candidatus Gottesmanbacteria bacterium]|nr:hypothetical protein [Candidatus Gottesmanbacteria bacterium]